MPTKNPSQTERLEERTRPNFNIQRERESRTYRQHEKIMKAGLYIRISTGEQSYFSLEAQKDQLDTYSRQQNIPIHKTYQDVKGRFTFEERQGLMDLLDDVEKGKVKIVLVTELDRLTGDEGILGYIKYTLKKYNAKLISINEQDQVRNEYQELTESILTALAKFENKRKKLRCRRGIERAKELGKNMNRCPFGYSIKNKGRKDSIPVPDSNSVIVKEIFDRHIKKQSTYSISKEIGIPRSTIRYILKNQFYCNPNLNGKHKTIITQKTFKKANQKT